MNKNFFSTSFSTFLLLIIATVLSGCSGIYKGGKADNFVQNYRIYDETGSIVNLDAIVTKSSKAEAVFLGERHNDSVAHDLELRLLKAIHKKNSANTEDVSARKTTLSLEFFETDVQHILDEYLNELITEKHFKQSSRTWQNYDKAYRPMIEYAKENNLDVLAANAPRRYVNMVTRDGRDALNFLPENTKKWLPPLPYGKASKAYSLKLDKLNKSLEKQYSKAKDNFFKRLLCRQKKGVLKKEEKKMKVFVNHNAQSLWDASMAWTMSESLKQKPGSLVININGSFHSENMLGIPEHLGKYRPGTRIIVVTIQPVEKFPTVVKEIPVKDSFIIYTLEKKND